MKTTDVERELMTWAVAELKRRMEEEHVVLEGHLLQVSEIQDRAVAMGLSRWDNWAYAAQRMVDIGLERRFRRTIAAWRRNNSGRMQ